MATPEEQARKKIDELLARSGWVVQDRYRVNLSATRGVAVREYPLTTGEADYLLFADRRALGAIEAKKMGVPLSGVESQSEKYSLGLPDAARAWKKPLPFLYESTGVETFFTSGQDPEPRSRRLSGFHRPETLLEWVKDADTLRFRLRQLPPLITGNLWPAQAEAIEKLEKSLAQDKPRALIQMATGSGKTFTAVSSVYRLIKFAKARRVLFLVDRANLGRQTLKEFRQYVTPDDGRKFTELYNVQHLESNTVDPVCRVAITTIQRLYSILSGEEAFEEEKEELSAFDMDGLLDQQAPKQLKDNPTLPIEYFDFIVIDECHRSIYNLWRQVLEYFDAYLIGLTATPSKQTFGFFNRNLVMEYSRPRAVADGVNVDQQVYIIRTQITEQGSRVDAGEQIGRRSRETRETRWERLDEELSYASNQLDREVVTPDQIRTVVRTFRDKLFTEIMPGRREVPKTLIFAKDDNHAEEILRIVREEFGKGNEFCKKITYRVTGIKPEDLIASFRNSYNPRIAVTVDMIATGTDIKPLEVLLFMRSVKSRVLYDQMLGRGTRVISPTDLQAVTPDAQFKDRFVIVDAVGITEREKTETQTLERKRSVSFEKLLEAVGLLGARDEATLKTLAGRLSLLNRKLSPQDRAELAAVTGGKELSDLANTLLDAFDDDQIIVEARIQFQTEQPTEEQLAEVEERLADEATIPFDNPDLRELLDKLHRKNDIVLDVVSLDRVLQAGYSEDATARARATVNSFSEFLEQHRDEITALQILYNQPYHLRGLAFRQIKELAEKLAEPPQRWTLEALWQAFAEVEREKVRGTSARRVLTDLVSLVRHAVQPEAEPELVPFPERVLARYREWLSQQEAAGRKFSAEQNWWLEHIASYIGVNLTIDPAAFDEDGEFFNRGGLIRAAQVFGKESLPALLEELNEALAA